MVRALFQIREHAQMIDTCLDDDHVGTKFMEWYVFVQKPSNIFVTALKENLIT